MYRNRDEKKGIPAMLFCVFSPVGNGNFKNPITLKKNLLCILSLVFLSVIVQHHCRIY